jgi:hypothetical protein
MTSKGAALKCCGRYRRVSSKVEAGSTAALGQMLQGF